MIYLKHPTLGNRHVDDAEVAALQAEGWVRWPRTRAEKAGTNAAPQEKQESGVSPGSAPATVGAAPETVEDARAALDKLGIAYHPNAGLKKLQGLLPG